MDRDACFHRVASANRRPSAQDEVNTTAVKPYTSPAHKLTLLCAIVSIIVGCSAAPAESVDATESLPDETALQALDTESFTQLEPTSGTQDGAPTLDVPDSCTDEKLQRAFQVGHRLGGRWVRWMWRHFQCCDKVERFTDALMVLVEKLEHKAVNATYVPRCRLEGIVAGAVEEVERLQTKCEADCFARGQSAGNLVAKTYCDQALAADGQLSASPWTRGPVGVCGFAYEMGCDAAFLGVTVEYVNDHGACEPYTRDPYTDIWTLSRLSSCDYARRSSLGH